MPRVSVIIPHKTKRPYIMTVESLLKQSYEDFEIIIMNDSHKKGASYTRNSGAKTAQGEYFLFADDDIIFNSDAIQKMVTALDSYPSADMTYCDYRLTGSKTGVQRGQLWDKKLLGKCNYISTMSMIRAQVFRDLGGFDVNAKRYQDWDLWVRFAAADHKAVYLPEVLFTACFGNEGISLEGTQSRLVNTKRLKDKHGIKEYDYSIIIPVHNQLDYTKDCLETVIKGTNGAYEIIVIDDKSDDGTSEWLLGQPELKVITNNKQMGHTHSVNLGVQVSSGRFIVLLNNDTLVPYGWNNRLSAVLQNNMNISCVGPATCSTASPQIYIPLNKDRFLVKPCDIDELDQIFCSLHDGAAKISKITGFCMMIPRITWNKVGPFDENIIAGGNEADWILRAIEMDLWPAMTTACYVHHYGGVSYTDRKELWAKGNEYVEMKHGKAKMALLEKTLYMDMMKGR